MRKHAYLPGGALVAALAASLIGCGSHPSLAPRVVPAAAPAAQSAHAPTLSHAITRHAVKGAASLAGISAYGHIGTYFTTFQGGGIRFTAEVANPTNVPVGYHWDSNSWSWGDNNEKTFDFSAQSWGGYEVTCTLLDASGNTLDSKTVQVEVFDTPSPPPIPPIPPIPPHAAH